MTAKQIFEKIPADVIQNYDIRQKDDYISYGNMEDHHMIFEPSDIVIDLFSVDIKSKNGMLSFGRKFKMVQSLIYGHVS